MQFKNTPESLILCCLLITQFCFAQDPIVFKKKLTFKEVQALEAGLKSDAKGRTSFTVNIDLVTGKEINAKYSPLLFKRTNDSFEPTLFTWYFFTKDSVLKIVYYNWSIYNPSFHPQKEIDKLYKYSKQLDLFEIKYNEIKENMTTILGEPKSKDKKENSQKVDIETLWENNICKALLTMMFYKEIDDIPGIGSMANFHIRIEIFYKRITH